MPINYETATVGGKANAMKWLIKRKKLNSENVIALGDDPNDMSMMKLAEFASCPGNAASEVKEFVKRKGGYVSKFSGHEGTVDVLRNYVRCRA